MTKKAKAGRTAALNRLARQMDRLAERADKLAEPERAPRLWKDAANATIPIPEPDPEAERRLRASIARHSTTGGR